MKKMILSLLTILAITSQALAEANLSAQEQLDSDALTAIVAQSAQIELVGEDGQAFDYTLPELLAGALRQNYMSGDVVLSATSVTCRDVTKPGILGATEYDCVLVLSSGDFIRKNRSWKGPQTESAYVISVKASKVVYPGAKLKIQSTKAVVQIAG